MATKTKGGKTTKSAPKAKAKKVGVCLMTGQPTAGGNFRPGMDARLKGVLIKILRGEAKLSSAPAAAIKVMRENGAEGLVGFRLNGDKLVKIGNFNIAENGKAKKGAKAAKELNSKSAFKGGSAKSRRKAEAQKKLAAKRAAEAANASADEDVDEGVEESDEEE